MAYQVCTPRRDTHTLNSAGSYRAVLCRTTKRVVIRAVSKSAGLSWKDRELLYGWATNGAAPIVNKGGRAYRGAMKALGGPVMFAVATT